MQVSCAVPFTGMPPLMVVVPVAGGLGAVAVIVTGPPLCTHLAKPLMFTTAIVVFDDDQATTITVEAGEPLNTPVAVNCTVPLGALAVALVGDTAIETRKAPTLSPQPAIKLNTTRRYKSTSCRMVHHGADDANTYGSATTGLWLRPNAKS